MIKEKNLLLVLSDIMLLKGGFAYKIKMRQIPFGLIALALLVFLSTISSRSLLYLLSLPIMMVYAILYSTFMHLSVKDDFRQPGSFSLTMDNVLLSFSVGVVATTFLGAAAAYVAEYLGLLNLLNVVAFSIFGAVFFFYLLRLSAETYEGADLDHLFGANFIPFIGVCIISYHVQGAIS